MQAALTEAVSAGNLRATTDPGAYESAEVAIVDIGLDVTRTDAGPTVDFTGLRGAVRALASRLPAGALMIVETTVPPGTCATVVAPEIESVLEERGLPPGSILLAHCLRAGDAGPAVPRLDRQLLARLRRPHSRGRGRLRALPLGGGERGRVPAHAGWAPPPPPRPRRCSRTATGRSPSPSWRSGAASRRRPAFDLFEAIDAIRMRPTHAQHAPAGLRRRRLLPDEGPAVRRVRGRASCSASSELEFPFSERALEVNDVMPLVTLDKVEQLLGGLEGRRILLLGVSYREGVADTRESPAATFVAQAKKRGADGRRPGPAGERHGRGPGRSGAGRAARSRRLRRRRIRRAALAVRGARPVELARRGQAAGAWTRAGCWTRRRCGRWRSSGLRVWSIGRGEIAA